MNLPRFLKCNEADTGRRFVLHTQSPKLLAEVRDDGLHWVKGWGDDLGTDARAAARLMREMGDWFANEP